MHNTFQPRSDLMKIYKNHPKGNLWAHSSEVMPAFKPGENVKIIDSEKDSNLIYNIKKIKKSKDGTTLYLLKSESSPITLLYYENKNSHLQIAD